MTEAQLKELARRGLEMRRDWASIGGRIGVMHLNFGVTAHTLPRGILFLDTLETMVPFLLQMLDDDWAGGTMQVELHGEPSPLVPCILDMSGLMVREEGRSNG